MYLLVLTRMPISLEPLKPNCCSRKKPVHIQVIFMDNFCISILFTTLYFLFARLNAPILAHSCVGIASNSMFITCVVYQEILARSKVKRVTLGQQEHEEPMHIEEFVDIPNENVEPDTPQNSDEDLPRLIASESDYEDMPALIPSNTDDSEYDDMPALIPNKDMSPLISCIANYCEEAPIQVNSSLENQFIPLCLGCHTRLSGFVPLCVPCYSRLTTIPLVPLEPEAHEVHVPEAPVAQEAPVPEALVPEVPVVQEVLAQEAPVVKEAPVVTEAQDAPSVNEPPVAPEVLVQEAPVVKEAPVVQEAPVAPEVLVQEAPVQEAPVQEAPVQEALVPEVPVVPVAEVQKVTASKQIPSVVEVGSTETLLTQHNVRRVQICVPC